jgi:hypothetical protein
MQSVLFAFLVLLCVVGVLACFVRSEYAFTALLMMFPVEQVLQSYSPGLMLRVPWAVNAAVAIVCIAAIALAITRGRDVWRGMVNKSYIFLLLMYAWIVVTLLWTPSQDAALHFMRIGWPYWILNFVIGVLLLRRIDDLDVNMRAFIYIGILLCVYIVVNPRSSLGDQGRLTVDLGYVVGVGELRSNPLAIADFGGMLAIAAAIYRNQNPTMFFNAVRAAAFIGGVIVCFMSGSRAQLLGGIALAALFFPLASGKRGIGSVLVVALLGSIGAALILSTSTFLIGTVGEARWGSASIQEGLGSRLTVALALAGGYAGSPQFWIQGLGASAFNFYYHDSEIGFWYPHNIMLEAIAEYGLLGLILTSCSLVFAFISWAQHLKVYPSDPTRRSLLLILGAWTIFQFLMALKQGAMLNNPTVFMFACICAKLWSGERHDMATGTSPALDQQPDEQDGHEGEVWSSPEAEAYARTDPARAG